MIAVAKKPHQDNTHKKRHDTVHSPLKNAHSINNGYQTSIIQLICPCDGGCPRCAPIIQPKLIIGQPDDKYEQEADRVADEVMRMPEPRLQRQAEEEEEEEELIQTKPLAEQITPLVQRQVEPEEEEEEALLQPKLGTNAEYPIQRQVEEEEEEEILQTKVNRSQALEVGPDLESRIQALRGGGQPLPKSARSFFEPRFGYDFSQVRVHTTSRAAETARELNARAFTRDRDVVFRAGQYAPETREGKKLLAHELTHVVQQNNRVSQTVQPLLIQMKKALKVGVYETKDQSKDIDDAVKEPIVIAANSIKEAANKLEKKKTSEGASIKTLSFYGHGAPGYQSLGAGKGYDAAKEISSDSINTHTNDYKKMFGTLADGARVNLRGCNVGAGKKGLELLKKIRTFTKTNNNIGVNAVAWTGKAYHKWFLWIDWWKQTGEMVTSTTKIPKVSWEDHKKMKKKKK